MVSPSCSVQLVERGLGTLAHGVNSLFLQGPCFQGLPLRWGGHGNLRWVVGGFRLHSVLLRPKTQIKATAQCSRALQIHAVRGTRPSQHHVGHIGHPGHGNPSPGKRLKGVTPASRKLGIARGCWPALMWCSSSARPWWLSSTGPGRRDRCL